MKPSTPLLTTGGLALCVIVVLILWLSNEQDRPDGLAQPTLPATMLPESAVPADAAGLAPTVAPEPSATVSGGTIPASSNPVAIATGQGSARDFQSRLEAITRLGLDLTDEDIAALYAYLRDTLEETGLQPGQGFALKNDVLNVLREQHRAPPDLTQLLLDLRRDESQHLVIRDYALQHMAPWYARVEVKDRHRIVKELRQAATEVDRSYAGTALLGLSRIIWENPTESLPIPTEPILELIDNESADLLARITAIQLSGVLDLQERAATILRLAGDETVPPTLRLAATRALGGLDNPESREWLQTAAAEAPDVRMRLAATAALRQ